MAKKAAAQGKVSEVMKASVATTVASLGKVTPLSGKDAEYLRILLPQAIEWAKSDDAMQAEAQELVAQQAANAANAEGGQGWVRWAWEKAKTVGNALAVGAMNLVKGAMWLFERPELMFVLALALLFVKRQLCNVLRHRRKEVLQVVRPPTMAEAAFNSAIETMGSLYMVGGAFRSMLESLASYVVPFVNMVQSLFTSRWMWMLAGVLAIALLRLAIYVPMSGMGMGFVVEGFDKFVVKAASIVGAYTIVAKILTEDCVPDDPFIIEEVEPGTPGAITQEQLQARIAQASPKPPPTPTPTPTPTSTQTQPSQPNQAPQATAPTQPLQPNQAPQATAAAAAVPPAAQSNVGDVGDVKPPPSVAQRVYGRDRRVLDGVRSKARSEFEQWAWADVNLPDGSGIRRKYTPAFWGVVDRLTNELDDSMRQPCDPRTDRPLTDEGALQYELKDQLRVLTDRAEFYHNPDPRYYGPGAEAAWASAQPVYRRAQAAIARSPSCASTRPAAVSMLGAIPNPFSWI